MNPPPPPYTLNTSIFGTQNLMDGRIRHADGRVEIAFDEKGMTRSGVEHFVDCIWGGLMHGETATAREELPERYRKLQDMLTSIPEAYLKEGLPALKYAHTLIETSKSDMRLLDAYLKKQRLTLQ